MIQTNQGEKMTCTTRKQASDSFVGCKKRLRYFTDDCTTFKCHVDETIEAKTNRRYRNVYFFSLTHKAMLKKLYIKIHQTNSV